MSAKRRGSAQLELVLVSPLLLFACVGIAWVGVAGPVRIAALSDARNSAWAGESRADPGEVGRLNHDPWVSLVEHRAARPFHSPGLGAREWVATAATGTHFRPWAHEDLPGAGAGDGTAPDLLRLLVERNPDSLPDSAAELGALDGSRFFDPLQSPDVRSAIIRSGASVRSPGNP